MSMLTGFYDSVAIMSLLVGVVILFAASWWKKVDRRLEPDGQTPRVMGDRKRVILHFLQMICQMDSFGMLPVLPGGLVRL